MTNNQLAPINLPQAPQARRIGQGTAVEQSRAQSEVYFRVALAHDNPRAEPAAYTAMRRACSNLRLAERAFYKMPRDQQTIEGPSVHLARELARIWGNIDYGVTELRQDDDYGQSEVLAFAWDLQTNARSAHTFIVPHKKDTRKGAKKLDKVQEIYENNANNGARRVREAIFAILPDELVEEAKEICRATLAKGDGTSIDERRDKAIAVFEKEFGVTLEQLESKLGRSKNRWDEQDVAGLSVTFRSLKAREVSKEDEFPTAAQKVTADELAGTDRLDEVIKLEKQEAGQ